MVCMSEVHGGNGADAPGPSESGGPVGATGPGGTARPGGWRGRGGMGGGKRLERKAEGRLLAGVCAGLADYLGVDANLVRIAFVVLGIVYGFGALAYLLAWALMPEQGESASIVEKIINKNST